jgi:hypothetical protein
MAVAYDTSTESHTGTTGGSGAASFTWDHTGGASARGALVFVFGVVTNALPPVTSVTYGGTTMTAIAYNAKDSDTEPGSVIAYYLDNCGTGTKAVVVNRSDATPWTHVLYAVCYTVTASGPTEVYLPGVMTHGGSTSNTAASSLGSGTGTVALKSVTDGSPGTNSLRFMGRYQGTSNVTGAGSGSLAGPSIDFGLYVIDTFYESAAGQGERNVGGATITDDVAAIALAVREIPPILVQPAAAAITIGTATPAIVAQNYILLQPAAAAVTVAGATPAVGTPVSIAPSAAAVTVGTATPALVAQNWPKAEPAAVAVTVGTATPAVVAQNYQLLQPAAAAITVGTATPAVALPVSVAPDAAGMSAAGATPAVWLPVSLAPGAVAVGITSATPAVATWVLVQPSAAALTIGMATPAVSAVAVTLVQPAAANVAIGTAAPSVTTTANLALQMAAAALMFAGMVPDVAATANVMVVPGPLGLTLTGYPPVVTVTGDLPTPSVGRWRRAPLQTIDALADDEEVLTLLYS